jgi:hypothetical protein
VLVAAIVNAAAQQAPAAFVYPLNGQQNITTSQPFQWTADPTALAYYLYVGTTQGANDVVNSGETLATSWLVQSLPAGTSLWGRIWTKYTSNWLYQDINFTTAPSATLISPLNGQTNVSTRPTFQWTSAPGALKYYLYVGTTQGANNVVNTGETQTTSYTVTSPLPVGAVLWARIWTYLNGVWVYQSDISFTISPDAVLVSPSNGQQNVGASPTFQWTSASGALGYYLYVGTTQGAKDLVNTGQIEGTTYTVTTPLPAGATLWARIWTNLNGSWVYQSDISFTISPDAVLVSPSNGQQNVSPAITLQWTSSPKAEAYYLYVGTAPGTDNVVNTGEIQGTSYTVTTPLPAGVVLWARIWTLLGGIWVYAADVNFTVSPVAALLYPVNGQQNVNTFSQFTWAPGINVQAYYLYVGTSPGAEDLVNTGEIQATSWSVPPLPVGQTLYARIWTKVNGVWSHPDDVSFTAALRFGYPALRSVDIDPTLAFSWSEASGGNGTYDLSIGSSPGGNDIYENAAIQSNSFTLPASALPSGSVLYARILETPADGIQRRADTVFTVSGTPVAAATMVYPSDGTTNADASQPFQWTATDLAQAYRLQVSKGSSLVLDTGSVTIPRYFDEALPLGSYTGQLGTEVGGQWYWTSFMFTVTKTGSSMANETNSALWATDYVRNMADAQNYPYEWTVLAGTTSGRDRIQALCNDYRDALLEVLTSSNVTARLPATEQPQTINIGFTTLDTHTLVEFWHTDLERWMLLDPTFDMTMVRASDGTWATAEDLNTSTLNQQWLAIDYQFLGSWGNSIAEAYYIDYPLLYLNLPPLPQPGEGQNPMPYLIQQPGPPLDYGGIYSFQCSGTTTLLIDLVPSQISCTAVDSLSQMTLVKTSVALPPGSTASVNIYSPVRNVF